MTQLTEMIKERATAIFDQWLQRATQADGAEKAALLVLSFIPAMDRDCDVQGFIKDGDVDFDQLELAAKAWATQYQLLIKDAKALWRSGLQLPHLPHVIQLDTRLYKQARALHAESKRQPNGM